ncbi:hypothetical protein ACG04R_18755 [Roseateles sp. BYS78W]|uniref:DUF4345 domain-containing protein n=1 Tax=Pelomonas candidula TaxID=3299025 RepID=A0ABW7HGE8_9BURK
MTEPAPNPYAAPQSDVVDAAPVAAVPARLPVTLLLRWLLAAVLVALGLWRSLGLISNWRYFTDSMVIDPAYNPWPWLALELFVVLTGALLAWRSRWVFVPWLLHVGLFARQIVVMSGGAGVPGTAYEVWAAELLVFGFCAWLWLRRGLR